MRTVCRKPAVLQCSMTFRPWSKSARNARSLRPMANRRRDVRATGCVHFTAHAPSGGARHEPSTAIQEAVGAVADGLPSRAGARPRAPAPRPPSAGRRRPALPSHAPWTRAGRRRSPDAAPGSLRNHGRWPGTPRHRQAQGAPGGRSGGVCEGSWRQATWVFEGHDTPGNPAFPHCDNRSQTGLSVSVPPFRSEFGYSARRLPAAVRFPDGPPAQGTPREFPRPPRSDFFRCASSVAPFWRLRTPSRSAVSGNASSHGPAAFRASHVAAHPLCRRGVRVPADRLWSFHHDV